MTTKKELIEYIEDRAKELVGIKYKYNLLNAFSGYKSWNKSQLLEFKEKFLRS